jgi:hypothetical protein
MVSISHTAAGDQKLQRGEKYLFGAMLKINRNKSGGNLIPANQQVMCEGFPENKWALGLAAFAFALTVGGGIIPA